MHCSTHSGSGCSAGDYDNAIDYLITMGGIAREDDYEYLGQDNFCAKEYMAYSDERASSDKRASKLIRVKVCAC